MHLNRAIQCTVKAIPVSVCLIKVITNQQKQNIGFVVISTNEEEQ